MALSLHAGWCEAHPPLWQLATENAQLASERDASSGQNAFPKLYLGLVPLAVHVPSYLTAPLQAGLIVDRETQWTLEYGRYTTYRHHESLPPDLFLDRLGGGWRWFPLQERFYLSTSLLRHRLSGHHTFELRDETIAAQVVSTAYTLEIALGNQWRRGNGLLGIDWGVFGFPLAATTQVYNPVLQNHPNAENPDAPNPENADDLNQAAEELRQAFSGGHLLGVVLPGTLRLYLGIVF